MERKEYTLQNDTKAYQGEINIRQSKELTQFFLKNNLQPDYDSTPNMLIALLLEKNIHADFLKIILIDAQGKKFAGTIDPDELSYSLYYRMALDFFIFTPGWIALFGSSNVQRATTLMNNSLSNTETSLKDVSLNSSDSTSEAEKKENGGKD